MVNRMIVIGLLALSSIQATELNVKLRNDEDRKVKGKLFLKSHKGYDKYYASFILSADGEEVNTLEKVEPTDTLIIKIGHQVYQSNVDLTKYMNVTISYSDKWGIEFLEPYATEHEKHEHKGKAKQ